MPKKQPPEILKYFLEDLLSWIPWFSYKSMFWSFWVYRFWKMFSILDENEEFYFKVWENNLSDYKNNNSKQFSYQKLWKIAYLNFYTIPEYLLENREELLIWIEKSLEVPSKTAKKTLKTKELSYKVLEYLLKIPIWKVTTYKLLAEKFWVHSRTIASIMKYNKEPLKYPCYKVVANDGKISWYNTERWVTEKAEKLKKDWIEIKNDKIDEKYFFID